MSDALLYYAAVECDCGGFAYTGGLTATLIEHKGRPVVTAESFEQETFVCDDCGDVIVTGEMEAFDE